MHLLVELTLPQQHGDVFFRQNHSVGVRGGMIHDVKCQGFGRRNLVFRIPLPTPIGQQGSYDQTCVLLMLGSSETLEKVGSFLEQIDPREFTIVIDETDVICVSTNRTRGRAPNIREY